MKTGRQMGRRGGAQQAALLCLFCLALAFGFVPATAGADAVDLSDVPFEQLLPAALRYGQGGALRLEKDAAKAELFRRGGASLRYMMSTSQVRNVSLNVMLDQLVSALDAEDGAPVLVEFLGSEYPRTRRIAAFFVGYYEAPQYARAVAKLLNDAEATRAAIRTVGKWQYGAAVPRLTALVEDLDERNRVAAANALRDIGDPHAIPALVGGLDDPAFTVRNAAQRALERFGAEAEEALLEAAETFRGVPRRHAIRALGRVGSERAVPFLESQLQEQDWGLRGDAARALLTLAPERARAWATEEKLQHDPFLRALFSP